MTARKAFQYAALIVVVLLYFANYYVLAWWYPKALEDYDTFLEFYRTRNTLYEFLFCLLFSVIFLDSSRRLLQAIGCFGMLISFFSIVDKGFFTISGFLVTDIILVIVAALVSSRVYRHGTGKQQ